MSEYTPAIGLEIHAELKTATKMFCRCQNDPNEKRPNINVCPVCLAHPGTLPVINKQAIKSILRVGLAVGGKLADFTEFDRKNYFYPDIPKGYQISQYKNPLISGGSLAEVALTRVHLEEDTARSIHDTDEGASLVDFNRSGLPLMELVTEPVINSGAEATTFAKELQLLLRYLDVSSADMEKGQMRVEANISIAKTGLPAQAGKPVLGTKVEVKNLNSFRAVERAVAYEIVRQKKLLEAGEPVVQETRGWNEGQQETFPQREKESSPDYRYFPDPDLPPLYLSEIEDFKSLATTIPETPWTKRDRFRRDFSLKDEDVEGYIVNPKLADFFEETAKLLAGDPHLLKIASNYITSDVVGLSKADRPLVLPAAANFAELIKMIGTGEISSRAAKDILALMLVRDNSPRSIAEEKGLLQVHDELAVLTIIEKVIADNQKIFADYKQGNEKVLQFLIGQGMKESRGSANPSVLSALFKKKVDRSR